jgi:hypothetical protein
VRTGGIQSAREALHFAAVHESARGRFCCKSPKIAGDDFFERKEAKLSSPINMAPAPRPLAKPPVSLSLGDEVPHIFTRESHQRPRKIFRPPGPYLLLSMPLTPDIAPVWEAVFVGKPSVYISSSSSGRDRICIFNPAEAKPSPENSRRATSCSFIRLISCSLCRAADADFNAARYSDALLWK